MDRDRGQGVLAARGVEPAPRRKRGTYPTTVRDDGPGQDSAGERRGRRRIPRIRHIPVHDDRRVRLVMLVRHLTHLPFDDPYRGCGAAVPRPVPRRGRSRVPGTSHRPRPATHAPPHRYPPATRSSARAAGAAAAAGPGCGSRPGRPRGARQTRPAHCHRCGPGGGESRDPLGRRARPNEWPRRTPRPAAGAARRRAQSAPDGRQAERRSRPLARREDRIARPARVRIRSRKPWVFARRRLFGWNVRLLTGQRLPGYAGTHGETVEPRRPTL
jgi:hypothetical protein